MKLRIYAVSVIYTWLIGSVISEDIARWCVIGEKEMQKCQDMKIAFSKKGLKPGVLCVQAEVGSTCIRKLEDNEADLATFISSSIFSAGKYHNLIPIAQEDNKGPDSQKFQYKAVVVLNRDDSTIRRIADLRHKKSCHSGTGNTASWNIPISHLYVTKQIPLQDCNNNVKNVAAYFSDSCAPGAYDPYYDPDGDNPKSICSICKDKNCPADSSYGSQTEALRCLVEKRGQVAFVEHTTVPWDARGLFNYSRLDYELLCPDGSKRAVDDYDGCEWATVPATAILTRATATITAYQKLLESAATIFGQNTKETFKMFQSSQYNGTNLLFTDGTLDLSFLEAKTDYSKYLGKGYTESFENIYHSNCKKSMRWCAIDQSEMGKCLDMRIAMARGRISTELKCVLGKSKQDCLAQIKNNQVDLVTADASNIYDGGSYYGLQPLMSERYPAERADDLVDYWSVAVIKKNAFNISINNLKGKKSCHGGIQDMAGYVLPTGYLVNTKRLILQKCDVPKTVASFFNASCIPGALSDPKVNPSLCGLCPSNCAVNGSYSGSIGAFRCLVETNADVAFVKHSTVKENTDGNNNENWASKLNSRNYELLCSDGTRKPITDYKTCHLVKVRSNAVLTSRGKAMDYTRNFQIILDRTQKTYSKLHNFFRLFWSPINSSNLLFRDETTELSRIPNPDYRKWLGEDFIGAMKKMDMRKCSSAGSNLYPTLLTIIGLIVLLSIVH